MPIITNDFQDVEKFCRQKRDSATTTTTMWSSEDVVDEASFVPTSPLAADNDSGIDRVSKHLSASEKRAIGDDSQERVKLCRIMFNDGVPEMSCLARFSQFE